MHDHFGTLEPRQLLAFDQLFTDVDGDTYRVQVIGAGTAAVTTSSGGTSGSLELLIVNGTDAKSRLVVSVTSAAGDGRVAMQQLAQQTPLRSISMAPVDLVTGGEVYIDDVGQLTFGNVANGIAQFQIGTAPSLLNLGSRTVTFATVGTGSGMSFATALKRASFQSLGGNALTFERGVNLLSSAGDLFTTLFNTPGGVIKEIRAGGVLRVTGTISGDVARITAASITHLGSNFLTTDGVIGQIKSAGDVSGFFGAARFGTFGARDFSGQLLASTPDAKGVTFNSIKLKGDIVGGGLSVAGGGTAGIIRAISMVNMRGDAGISARGIGTFKASGFVDFSLITLTEPAGVALKSIVVGGLLTGSAINTGTAGIGTFKVLGVDDALVDAAFITTLTAGLGASGGLRNTTFTLSGADPKGFAVRTAKLGEGLIVSDLKALGASAGVLGSITGRSFDDSDIEAPRINRLTATGRTDGVASTGTDIIATDTTVGAVTMGRLDFRGRVEFLALRSAGSIDRFSASTLTNSSVFAGRPSPLGPVLPADLTGFVTASIGRFTLTAPFDPGALAFNNTQVVATDMGVVSVAGRINTTGLNDGSDPFGFGARTFGSITLKGNDGATVKPDFPFGPGEYGGLPGDIGNFRIRVYA